MKGYWIILGTEVTDKDAQAAYGSLWAPIAEKYKARIISGTSTLNLLEARDAQRMLIVEFPSYADARTCYEDPDYQHAKEFALKASKRSLILIEGEIQVR